MCCLTLDLMFVYSIVPLIVSSLYILKLWFPMVINKSNNLVWELLNKTLWYIIYCLYLGPYFEAMSFLCPQRHKGPWWDLEGPWVVISTGTLPPCWRLLCSSRRLGNMVRLSCNSKWLPKTRPKKVGMSKFYLTKPYKH